jgi:hypothetical protein
LECAVCLLCANQGDREGFTPLHHAVLGNRIILCKRLVEAGVDIDAVDKLGRTPFLVALLHGRTECALSLALLGADVGLADSAGKTPSRNRSYSAFWSPAWPTTRVALAFKPVFAMHGRRLSKLISYVF